MIIEKCEMLFDRSKAKIDRLRNYSLLRKKFKQALGYPLNLENPKTWSEKIQWRKVHVRNPDYTRATDKLEMQNLVEELLGKNECVGLFAKLFAQTNKPDSIDFDALPANYILKPTHGSGWFKIVTAASPQNSSELRKLCKHWLARSYGYHNHEWAYLDIKPRIMVEELLQTSDGKSVMNVKLHVVGGEIMYIYAVEDPFGERKPLHLTPDWQLLPEGSPKFQVTPVFGWEKIKQISERIGEYFDYVRVDFLVLESRFVLNELTLYPASGMDWSDTLPILKHFDDKIGKKWNHTLDGRRQV